MLKDKECEEDIRKTIWEFLITHENDETSVPIQWETLKCVLQGDTHQARLKILKKKRTKKISTDNGN